uniref:Uncharacterized protein n=1 Tax=Oryza barthii TaxID=65489 RepID=A0A0D3EXH7_9ORYZ
MPRRRRRWRRRRESETAAVERAGWRRRRRWRRRESETAAVERAGQPAFAFGRACGSVGGRGAGAGGGGRPCNGAVGRFQVLANCSTFCLAGRTIGSWRILNVATADKTVPADNGISTRIHTPNVTTDTKVGEAQNRKAIAEHV